MDTPLFLFDHLQYVFDQVYSNQREPTKVNASQHESTQVNTNLKQV